MFSKIKSVAIGAIATVTVSFTAVSQTTHPSFLYAKDGAVFYPSTFDSVRMMPSFAVIKELKPASAIPQNWKITPQYNTVDGKCVVTIPIDQQIDLYGNGEVLGNLKRNGTSFTTWNTDNYTYVGFQQKQLYQSHPWILGVRADGSAFGILVDNTWKQHFELSNPIKITCEGPAPRVIIFDKESPQAVMEELANLTGKMEMPPLWSLGFQQCRYSYTPDTRVREVAQEFRNRQIPCDVIWMDIDYMDGYRVFTFNPKTFSDPKALNDDLHKINFKAVYMIDPGVKADTNYFVYQQGKAGNYWVKDKNGNEYNGNVWPGKCAFPDFTSPQVRNWWAGLYGDFMAKGIDGVWNDMNEPAVFDVKSMTMPEDNQHVGGDELPADCHLRYHNVYGMLMVKASRDGVLAANPTKRPFVLSRSNFIGGQRYGATWTGDNASTWDYLRLSIPMSLNLSLSGQPFNGPDIGGFAKDANAELLAHWMAVGVYYPFSRNHAANNTANQEPWAFGKQVEDVSRTAINRRYRLLPYLYTLFHEVSQAGLPVMRPIYWSDLKDTTLRREQEAFLLGNDLMIVPRWASKPSLPKTDWDIIPFESSDDGYQPHVLLRPGAIVPMSKVIQSTVNYTTDSITLYVNPAVDGTANGTLYDDAGEGFEYQKGNFSMTQFKAVTNSKGKLVISITQTEGKLHAKRVYRIAIVADGKVTFSAWSKKTKIATSTINDSHTLIDAAVFKPCNIQFEDKNLNGILAHPNPHEHTDLHF